MNKLLSKEEIKELLGDLKSGKVKPPTLDVGTDNTSHLNSNAKPIDLMRLPTSSKWRIPNLDLILESYGRNYSVSLTTALQRSVSVKLSDLNSVEFDQFLTSVAKRHVAVGIIKLEPLKAGMLMVFENNLSSSLVDLMLGANGALGLVKIDRHLSSIEQNLVKYMMEPAGDDFKRALANVTDLNPKFIDIETNPRLVNIVSHDTTVLTATFTVTIEGYESQLTTVIPLPTLEPIRDKLRDGAFASSSDITEDWRPTLINELNETKVDVQIRYNDVKISSKKLVDLAVGDFFEIGPPNADVFLCVEGIQKFKGLVGEVDGCKAFQTREIVGEK